MQQEKFEFEEKCRKERDQTIADMQASLAEAEAKLKQREDELHKALREKVTYLLNGHEHDLN